MDWQVAGGTLWGESVQSEDQSLRYGSNTILHKVCKNNDRLLAARRPLYDRHKVHFFYRERSGGEERFTYCGQYVPHSMRQKRGGRKEGAVGDGDDAYFKVFVCTLERAM